MQDSQLVKLRALIQKLGRYPPEAFEFLHKGLDFTVQRMHGPISSELLQLDKWLSDSNLELSDLSGRIEATQLPPEVALCVQKLGGPERAIDRLNRHVGGADLCWGLRDLAMQDWGLLASTVLRRWGVTRTLDFGRMVFALVESDLMKKQPDDRIDDFDNVFDFDEALDGSFRIGACPSSQDASDGSAVC